mmetsp:Transcript_30475/g.65833  ORF Transcript_30475/g.65833 Transcript_30475/m.65833 type:complete len:133 (-) Transcript_30475:748-1146(-)
MSNYPPNARGDGLGSGGGIAEAYPSSTADRSEEAEYAYHSSDQNNMMHVYRQPLDRSNISSNDDGGGGGGGSGMSRRGSEVSRASFTSSSSQQQQQQQQWSKPSPVSTRRRCRMQRARCRRRGPPILLLPTE